jgi:hypothetical protein
MASTNAVSWRSPRSTSWCPTTGALKPLEPYGREDLLEIMDDRAEKHATVITAQLPVSHWNEVIPEPMVS